MSAMIHCAEHVLISRPHHVLGQALHRQLLRLGHPASHINTAPLPDFNDPRATRDFLEAARPEQVFLIAQDLNAPGHPGALVPPERSADANLIRAAYLSGVKRLIYVADARVYPATCFQPMAETFLHSGPCGREGEGVAQAQRYALRLCESLARDQGQAQRIDFRGAVVSEVYGPLGRGESGRRAAEETWEGLVQSVVRQFIEADERQMPSLRLQLVPGTAAALDLLFCDDAAEALVYLLELPREALSSAGLGTGHINIGAGVAVPLGTLVRQVALTVGYRGPVELVSEEPDGARPPSRWLDTRRLRDLSWEPLIDLECGLELTCMDQRLRNRSERGSPAQTASH